MPLTNNEVEICKFVVLRFIEQGEFTSRPALLKEFKGELRAPLDRLVQRSVVIQTGMVDNKEFYVPTAIAFDYCGDPDALAVAKKSTDEVLSVILHLYDEDVEADSLDRVHSQHDVIDHLALGVDEKTVRLGLYFAKGFNFIAPQQMDANYVFFESFRIHERIYEVMETDSPWDSHIARTRKFVENYPRSASLESYDQPEQPRDFRELENKEQAISDASALIGRQAGIAFLVLDLDNFKQANDALGHEKGDVCLQSVLDIFLAVLGKRGRVYRWGKGDEFIVSLPDFSSEEAFATAERIRRTVEAARLGVNDSPITVSIGVSGRDLLPSGSVNDLMVGADDAMLQVSKKQGKNCVSIWAGAESDAAQPAPEKSSVPFPSDAPRVYPRVKDDPKNDGFPVSTVFVLSNKGGEVAHKCLIEPLVFSGREVAFDSVEHIEREAIAEVSCHIANAGVLQNRDMRTFLKTGWDEEGKATGNAPNEVIRNLRIVYEDFKKRKFETTFDLVYYPILDIARHGAWNNALYRPAPVLKIKNIEFNVRK